ncbi:DUF2934 domain-containing protein [Prosthecobacter sp.]|uniref:DUF2934 domain-containing protein n=1 Tax=Prosthecobacter sp. TaxID=1965333 RepID=UPI002ABA005C|nr:DUF2934 domain-containing protein [Prosthecobacter sp.]MDZ4403619.1 DUF2934 domain-containing protein [Prosthecobacter sp.]
MNQTPPTTPQRHFDETRMLAYHLWQRDNCPPGQDLKYWLQAEEQLFGKRPAQSKPVAAAGNRKLIAAKRDATPAGNGSAKRQPGNAKKAAKAR